MRVLFILYLLSCHSASLIYSQKNREAVVRSSLLEIDFPSGAIRENGIFRIAAAKSVLDIEASFENAIISEVEVLTFENASGDKEESIKSIENLKKSIRNSGYEIIASIKDGSYLWLTKERSYFLAYVSASKKEANAYIGVANHIPENLVLPNEKIDSIEHDLTAKQETVIVQNSTEGVLLPASKQSQPNSRILLPELVGNWGTLAGAKVNRRDESTGNMLVSGISKGYGLELRADGSFLQSTVVTSGRPNYRVFVSTAGEWEVVNNKLMFYPSDRYYRKWENEIIMVNEHSIPETYEMYWQMKINEFTGKQCLYTMYESDSTYNELCIE